MHYAVTKFNCLVAHVVAIVLASPTRALGGAKPRSLAHCHQAVTSVEIMR
jgi:hypothetical protein